MVGSMKAGDVQLQLAANNRWWRVADWQRSDPDLRAARTAPFRYRAGCLSDLTPGGLYVLRGPRRSGKSTEIKYAIADLIAVGVPPRNIVHAAVDGWRAEDIRTLVTGSTRTFLAGTTGTRYWFIDEISSVSGDWPNTIKNLRDNDPDFAADTVVLTGSSAARLHEVRKALAGRRGAVTGSDRAMLPMRFTDVVHAAGVALPESAVASPADLADVDLRERVGPLLPYLNDLVALWEVYLRVGGFPQAVASWRTTGDVEPSFTDTMWDVVYGDAITGARFSAPQTATLLSRISGNLCSPLNVADLARDVDVSHATARDRLANLAQSFLTWPCHREQGLMPKLNSQAKWYFTDPVLARLAALRGYGREPDLTQLSEQQIGLALLRALDATAIGAIDDHDALLYYRGSTGSEIDFVGRRLAPMAIESKYVDDGRWGRTQQTFKASPWSAIVATRSVVQWEESISVLPAPILAVLLGQ
jgi:predicted AAA+ superfamily ATPase